MPLEPWRQGVVIRIEEEAFNTRRFWIQIPEVDTFDFKAGQFITLDLPIHEQKNKRWRSYSIASWPDGTNVIELLIVLLEGGLGTTYFFNEVKVGTELTLRGPQGVFTLPSEIDRDLFLICTGTGIAPFRSMLHYMQLHNVPYEKVYLVFGCRTQKDLLYFNEMKELEQTMRDFTFMPTLSREDWDGHRGYVHSLYEEICKGNKVACDDIMNLKPAYFYLCGWKAMVDDAKHKIIEMGYDKKAVHLELYG